MPKLVKKEPEPEIIEVLSLAPFAPSPKLFFDRVVVGETATCKLLVKNPTKQSLTVSMSFSEMSHLKKKVFDLFCIFIDFLDEKGARRTKRYL